MPSTTTPRALRMWGVRCALDTGVARALGLTSDELESRLRRGSLAQVAADRGVPMARLRQVARAIAEPQLAAAVAAGVIKDGERTALFRRLDSKTGPWSDLAPVAELTQPPSGSAVVVLALVLVVLVAPGPGARRIRGGEALVELLVELLVLGVARRGGIGSHADLTYDVLTWV